ncbi:hypothetical protein BJL95_09065 [Methylomonas sp. LWB]|nr:hypothetical protein BJL95_09065 [Methylomonas sp. LWB]
MVVQVTYDSQSRRNCQRICAEWSFWGEGALGLRQFGALVGRVGPSGPVRHRLTGLACGLL